MSEPTIRTFTNTREVEIWPETGTCDFNPEMATLGEWARGVCNTCREPLDKHWTPEQWKAVMDSESAS